MKFLGALYVQSNPKNLFSVTGKKCFLKFSTAVQNPEIDF